jgi:hypothetical protein
MTEPTVFPKAIDAEVSRRGRRDSGISVDTDDLAIHFLSGALGHGPYEAASNATPELFVTSASPHDEPLIGPNFDPDNSLWDRAIDLALQEGRAPYTQLDDDEDDELEALNRAARSLFDTDVMREWARFDDDERWRETARTGRAL